MSLNFISGQWFGSVQSHYYVHTDDGDVVTYRCYPVDDYNIVYTRSSKTWTDGSALSDPVYFNFEDVFVTNTSLYNPERVFGFRANGDKVFEFVSTHWQAPPNTNSYSDPPENDPPPTPVFVPRSARRGNLNFW